MQSNPLQSSIMSVALFALTFGFLAVACSDSDGGNNTSTATGGASGTGGAQTSNTSVGGGTNDTGGSTATATGGGTAASDCTPAAPDGPDAMGAGNACLNCHSGNAQPTLTLAGTLYSAATGGNAVSGATVTVTGSDGSKVTMVTGSTGNFYSSSAITFPATVSVSKCPDTAPMVATITSGDCNSCHDSSDQIHLP